MAKFIKGQSGNPAGKKSGTLNKRTKLTTLLEPHAEKLIDKAVELALDGDVNALRLCVERLIPKATNKQIQIDLESNMECNDSLSLAGKKIIAAITTGSISPDDGRGLMGVLDSQRKLIEHTDLETRIKMLENINKHGNSDEWKEVQSHREDASKRYEPKPVS